MSPKNLLSLALAVVVGTACARDQPTAPLSGDPLLSVVDGSGPSVTGRAEFTQIFPPIGPVTIRYTLNAITLGDGSTRGEVEFRATGLEFPLDVRWHATVLCLSVDPDGRTARVGARIDGTSQEVGFVVEDNGVGSPGTPDRASPSGPRPDDPVRGALDHCAGKTLPLPMTNIDLGDLMVRP